MSAMDSNHIDSANPQLSASAEQVLQHRDGLANSLGAEQSWFYEYARPVTVMVHVKELAEEVAQAAVAAR
jgi:hypothetical protein